VYYVIGCKKNITDYRGTYHGTNSLPFFKTCFYNLDVSTQKNISSGGARQLNMMISLDIGNSYALRRAADAPGSVRMN
jgi:hypothetical protein